MARPFPPVKFRLGDRVRYRPLTPDAVPRGPVMRVVRVEGGRVWCRGESYVFHESELVREGE